ncbi:MAG: hypothetical protein DMG86_14385 [Acidobacteria bacterium]|nr:MAG: hypothetical protein DMG86_14385 [Acidobacteriota bacterium]
MFAWRLLSLQESNSVCKAEQGLARRSRKGADRNLMADCGKLRGFRPLNSRQAVGAIAPGESHRNKLRRWMRVVPTIYSNYMSRMGEIPRAWFRWLERKLGWHLLIVAKLRQMEVTIFVVRR